MRSALWDMTLRTHPQLPHDLSMAVFYCDEAEPSGGDPEPLEKGRKCRENRTKCSILDLQGKTQTVGRTGAKEALRSAFRGPTGKLANDQCVGCDRAAQHLGMTAHRSDHSWPTVDGGQSGERVRAPVEGERECRNAAAVDRHVHRGRVDLCCRRDNRQHLLLEWMVAKR